MCLMTTKKNYIFDDVRWYKNQNEIKEVESKDR